MKAIVIACRYSNTWGNFSAAVRCRCRVQQRWCSQTRSSSSHITCSH